MFRLSEASVTRPNNATQYTAGEVIGAATGDAMEFFSELHGIVRSAVLIDSAAEATKPDIDLLLFDAEPTVAADNAAFAVTDAQMERCIGAIQFAGANFRAGSSGNGVIVATAFGELPYSCLARKLYGVLVARNTYTPIANEKFTVRLGLMHE